MKARVKWVEKRTFLGESGTGHGVVLGTTRGADGHSLHPSPMELVLIGAGGCASFDVVQILEKSRQPIDGCVAELKAERAERAPRVFTRIHMHFVVSGRGLSRDKVARAISLSADKYCSVSAMLGHTAEITHDFEIVDTSA